MAFCLLFTQGTAGVSDTWNEMRRNTRQVLRRVQVITAVQFPKETRLETWLDQCPNGRLVSRGRESERRVLHPSTFKLHG